METLTLNPIQGSKNISVDVDNVLPVLGLKDIKPTNHGMFRILSQEDGDKRLVWDRDSLTQINEAKKMFDDLVEQGFVPHEVDAKGKQTPKVMEQFDPYAEEIIFAPMHQLVGG